MRPFLLLPSLLLAATATAASVPRDSRLGVVPNGVFDSHPDEPVQDHYVVQYLAGLDAMTRQEHIASVNALIAELGGGIFAGVLKSFDFGAFQGYYVNAPKIALVQLVDTGLIKSIEQDKKIFISSPVLPRPHDKVLRARNAPTDTTVTTVLDATWGQARISHRIPDQTDYTYETISHPAAATVYVIDTGIQTTHWEFNSTSKPGTSRARWGHNWIASSPDTDENGHGTHVSGTIAGLTYGVAPRAALVACKVFDADGGGTWSDMIDALGWACHDAAARGAVNASVVNLSAGGGFYQPINDAVSAAVGLGLAVVVAAGNDGGRVGDISPASCPDAVAVSATDEQDRRPDWASWGPGVAFFAPGVDVTSAWIGGGGQESAVLDGTSMSCPHVAGLAAYWMGMFGGHTPAQLRARLGRLATNGTVVDAGAGSANAIVYNGNKVYFDEVTDSVG